MFLIGAAVFSYFWTRPEWVALGRFDAANAPKVQAALEEAKIPYQPAQPEYTFQVQPGDYERARLLLASAELDPTGAVWTPLTWKGMTSWSDTEFDKRQYWVEQKQNALARAIRTLSVVDQASVQVTVPMEQKLFKEQEKPVTASVMVLPKKGQKLTTPVVESIMELVAASVEGMDRNNVKVFDSSTSRMVSADAFKKADPNSPAEVSNTQLAVEKQYQDRWQQQLTEQLERAIGPGNVSVIVRPVINWDRVTSEAIEYKPTGANGKGVVLSESNKKESTEGGGSTQSGTGASGVTPNVETGVPSYPGSVNQGSGALSADKVETIVNYLVSQTKTITEKPGGAIEEISVGVLVNSKTVDSAAEQSIMRVIQTAMGSKAKVDVAAMVFAPSAWDLAKPETPQPIPQPFSLNWMYVILAVALTLGGIGAAMLFFRPRKPVLEPVFAGPEAAMMGGIPVADLEMAAAIDAYTAQGGPAVAGQPPEQTVPATAEDIAALAPEEIALLGDEFLQKLGVDPAKVRMREKVEKIAKANPEAVATLLKTWISDG
ncbi:MAG TPA: flagellar M-ring protein FliF C-terminal domain-containing protein [Symbiobacteriaceae bacterium]|nr:flagellar M-ring protein FliF C-terminal domain-containing protein [Symbiobacteriaceae bacterium]